MRVKKLKMPYLTTTKNRQTSIALYIQPKASKNRFCGLHGEEMKLAVTAPPVDGKANKAVIQFMAGFLGVARSAITIKRGLQSRHKQLVVEGISCDEVRIKIDKTLL
jgi:uncharacterized protein (TIGR00251 family)